MPPTQTLTLQTPDGSMAGYVARPDGEPRGGVVVVQEAFGVTEHIEDVARRVATAGYLALAPALFHRTGGPALPYDDFEQIKPHMGGLTKDGVVADLDASFGWLREAGVAESATGIVGFCMGGTVATFAAAQYAIGGAVGFYGGGVSSGRFGFGPLAELAPEFRTPWLGIYGGQDQSIPPEDVEAMRTGSARATVETDLVVYEESQHGFHCDDRPAVYDEAASVSAWARTLDFFAAHLG